MKHILTIVLFCITQYSFGQPTPGPRSSTPSPAGPRSSTSTSPAPKLIVGIVVDQMRWDYLHRYQSRYGPGGFLRLLGEGYTCENTLISHLPSFTAVGHSTIYTGSVPAIHGITGNDWTDQASGRPQYCTGDSTVESVGTPTATGKMSPHNLLATTITDELRISSNYQSKVVGISLKDRASILPAGHNPTGAFWMDDSTGNFVTSTWYMKELPEWVQRFNQLRLPQKLVAGGWNTLYPIASYTQSTADDVPWEGLGSGETAPVFPHDVAKFYQHHHDAIRSTPFGNTLTLDFARAAVEGYSLGQGKATDFLAINCASTDYVGHEYGPNSIEVEDTYLRLDKDLATFFDYLDKKIGKGNYLVFLTADHGGSHAINYMKANHFPADFLQTANIKTGLDNFLYKKFGVYGIVLNSMNYYINFNLKTIALNHLSMDSIRKETVSFLQQQPGIQFAVDLSNMAANPLPEPIRQMVINGYNYRRCGDVTFIPEPGWFSGSARGTTHGTWNLQDIHIPLVFMGWGIKHGASFRTIHMTDIAPTIAALLRIQMPNGCVGSVIEEVMK
ncbi:MAG TPA: alkaline phosphatase PafA [Puia sp.]|nr:alkaline phosphatase PafA [Puia sp.]